MPRFFEFEVRRQERFERHDVRRPEDKGDVRDGGGEKKTLRSAANLIQQFAGPKKLIDF